MEKEKDKAKMKMDYSIGEEFYYNHETYVVVEDNSNDKCGGCSLRSIECASLPCHAHSRRDRKEVMFKLITDKAKMKKPIFESEAEYIDCMKKICVFDLSDEGLNTSLKKAKQLGYIKKSVVEEAEEMYKDKTFVKDSGDDSRVYNTWIDLVDLQHSAIMELKKQLKEKR